MDMDLHSGRVCDLRRICFSSEEDDESEDDESDDREGPVSSPGCE